MQVKVRVARPPVINFDGHAQFGTMTMTTTRFFCPTLPPSDLPLPPTQIMIWPIIQVFLAAVQLNSVAAPLRIAAGCSAVRPCSSPPASRQRQFIIAAT